MNPMKVLRGSAVVLLAVLTTAAAADAKKTKGKPAAEEKKEAPKWDVSAPPGEWSDVAIDTTETTWSSVDVSPDGRTIVFDMLGDLYSVPIEGGEARSL